MRFVLLACALAISAVAAEPEKFSDRLSDDERRAAGLDRLTREQLAALDALVRREREGGERSAREQARAEAVVELKEKVRAEAVAEAKTEAREEEQRRRIAETRVLSRLAGKYDGWSRGTEFRLQNGQVWRHTGSDIRYVDPVDAPPILIEKVFGGWRLYDASGGWCPVTRVK